MRLHKSEFACLPDVTRYKGKSREIVFSMVYQTFASAPKRVIFHGIMYRSLRPIIRPTVSLGSDLRLIYSSWKVSITVKIRRAWGTPVRSCRHQSILRPGRKSCWWDGSIINFARKSVIGAILFGLLLSGNNRATSPPHAHIVSR